MIKTNLNAAFIWENTLMGRESDKQQGKGNFPENHRPTAIQLQILLLKHYMFQILDTRLSLIKGALSTFFPH